MSFNSGMGVVIRDPWNNPSLNSSIIRNSYENSKRCLCFFLKFNIKSFGSIIFVDTSHDDSHVIVKICHMTGKLIIIKTRLGSGIFPLRSMFARNLAHKPTQSEPDLKKKFLKYCL